MNERILLITHAVSVFCKICIKVIKGIKVSSARRWSGDVVPSGKRRRRCSVRLDKSKIDSEVQRFLDHSERAMHTQKDVHSP